LDFNIIANLTSDYYMEDNLNCHSTDNACDEFFV